VTRSRNAHSVALVLLAVLWLASGLLVAVHVLGVISNPGIGRVLDQCPPEATGLHELCAPVSVRVELPAQLPASVAPEDRDNVELSGPVEATLALMNPTAQQRFAYNAAAGLAWLTVFAFLSLFLWPLRPQRRRHSTAPRVLDSALTAGGVVVAFGGVAAALVQRWSVETLASAARAGYEPAAELPVGAAVVPVVLGLALVLVGTLRRVARRQSEDLQGLV